MLTTSGYRAGIYGIDPDIIRRTVSLIGGHADTTDPTRELYRVRNTMMELTNRFNGEWSLLVNGRDPEVIRDAIAAIGFDPDARTVHPVVGAGHQ